MNMPYISVKQNKVLLTTYFFNKYNVGSILSSVSKTVQRGSVEEDAPTLHFQRARVFGKLDSESFASK